MRLFQLAIIMLLLAPQLKADQPTKWFAGHPVISIGTELNYTGYNALLLIGYQASRHNLRLGLSWNISDSYINNPLIGFASEYRYKVAWTKNFEHELGIAFRNQKPIKETSINQVSIASYTNYKFNSKLSLGFGIGYGVVNERYKGVNRAVDNQLGSFVQIGCAYTWE